MALTEIATKIDQVELFSNKLSLEFKIVNRLFQKYNFSLSLPDENFANKKIKKLINENVYDLIWISKGLTIKPDTLKYIKKKLPDAIIVNYSPDNIMERHNQSLNFMNSLHLYDYHITTKSYIIEDFKNKGARNVIFTNQSFEPTFHYPRVLTEKEKELFGADIGFVGVWEKERCDSILYLVENGLNVKVFGDGKWNQYKEYHPNLVIKSSIFSEDYSKALQAFKISLCFLRKINHDLQTSRTMEIPACGGFMMAERTSEHLQLFEEGREAEFFSTNQELLEKCIYYLKNMNRRNIIAKNGYERCIRSGYSNLNTLKKIISNLK